MCLQKLAPKVSQNCPGFGTKMLPTWFWWSNLSKENLFWLFQRGSLKTQKKVKNRYFSNMKNGVCFRISQMNFQKPIRYSWILSWQHQNINCNYIFSMWSSADKSSLKINFFWKRSKKCDMRHLQHSQKAKLAATCLIRFQVFATSYDPMSISGQSWG